MQLKPVRRSIGFLLLADGIGALFTPSDYVRKLQFGNALADDLLEYLAENPKLICRIKLVEIAVGIWLVLR